MRKSADQLQRENDALRAQNDALQARLAATEEELAETKRQLQYIMGRFLGRKSEALDPRQLELLLGGVEAQCVPEPEEGIIPFSCAPRRRRRRVYTPRLPEDLPTEDIVLDPEEVKVAPELFECIGEEITQELGMVSPKYFRRRYIRRKWKKRCDHSRAPLIAALPPRLIPGSYAGVEVLVDIALQKYLQHLPLYRQEQVLRMRYGIELSRKTMCDWLGQVAWWLKPIYNHIAHELQSGGYLQADETPVRYNSAEGSGSRQGYMWVFHRPGAGVLYEWHTGRGADCLNGMLAKFGGHLQCDGYSAYSSYQKQRAAQIAAGGTQKEIRLLGCWAHVRRKFHAALEECPTQAYWLIKQIQQLYAVETELRNISAGPKLRQAVRAARSAAVLTRIGKVLRLKLAAHRPSSQMGKAIRYALSLWPQLSVYLEDDVLEIDNNPVENAIRPTAVGKKNFLFIGHPEAGERSAILYTLIENCKRLGINPEEYLLDVLRRLPILKSHHTIELTPANWAKDRRARAA